MNNYMVSLKPSYVEAFLLGLKSMEIRTKIPQDLRIGDRLFVCKSRSHGQVIFTLLIDCIWIRKPEYAYKEFGKYLFIDHNSYLKYVDGHNMTWILSCTVEKVFKEPAHVNQFGMETAPQWFRKVPECTAEIMMKF